MSLLQCDPRLSDDPSWDKWGCNIDVCFYHAEKRTKLPITACFMKNAAKIWEAKGWIDNEFAIQKYAEIYSWLGLKVDYLGHLPPDYKCKFNEFEHLYWERVYEGVLIGHFTSGDGYGHCTFDPYGLSNSVRYGTLKNKRVFVAL